MKKITIYLSSAILLTILCLSIYSITKTINTYGSFKNKRIIVQKLNQEPNNKGANPGYEEQLRRIKLPHGGDFPIGSMSKWLAHEQQFNQKNASEVSPFEFVQESGPNGVGGRTRAIHIDPRNSNIVLAGAASGGIWRSEDKAITWSALNDNAQNLSVTSITYNPFNPDIIYYSTGEVRGGEGRFGEGIFKSIDGGLSFTQLPSSVNIQAFQKTWKIAHSLIDSNTVYVATNTKLYLTTDGGNSWNAMDTYYNLAIFDILLFEDGSILLTTLYGGIEYSATGESGTFNKLNVLGYSIYSRGILANCKSQPNVVYAMVGNGYTDTRIFKSIDKGLTWTLKSTPPIGLTQGDYNLMLKVNNTNPNQIVCGAVTAAQSNNGGDTWGFKTLDHFDYHNCINFPDNNDAMLVCNDGGVFEHRYSNPFFSRDRSDGYNVTQYYYGGYSPNNNLTIGGTQDNGTVIVKNNNFYYAWTGDGTSSHINQQDQNIAYYGMQYDGLFRGTGVQNGSPIPTDISYTPLANEGVNFINVFEMNYADGNQLYYRTNKGLWRTLNQGNDWAKINTPYIYGIENICLSEDKDPFVYLFGAKNGLISLMNLENGMTDTEFNTVINVSDFNYLDNVTTYSIDIHPNNNHRIIFCNNNFTSGQDQVWLIKNTLYDPTPISIKGDLPDNLPINSIQFHPYNPDSIFFVGTDFGVYYTLDAGQHWVKEDRFPNVIIKDIRVRASDGMMFFFTFGRGVWQAQLSPAYLSSSDLPFSEDFERGNWDNNASSTRSNNYGRTKVKPDGVESYHLSLDLSKGIDDATKTSYEIRLNTTDVDRIKIKYDFKIRELNISASSGLFISYNNGVNYSQIRSFIDLEKDSLLTDSLEVDITGNSETRLKFEYNGHLEAPFGGFLLDNIKIDGEEIVLVSTNLLDQVTIYPNPTHSYFRIEGIDKAKLNSLELISIDGKLHKIWQSESLNKNLDISQFPSGNYQIVFKQNGIVIGTKPLLIQ